MSRAIVDKLGKRFGKLRVVARADNLGRYPAWRCLCDCGHEKVIASKHLVDKGVKSCGCLLGEQADLLGKTFGLLTVQAKIGPSVWSCSCACGSMMNKRSHELLNTKHPSCGCPERLTGKIFGMLTVLEKQGSNGKRTLWNCACSCGGLRVVTTKALRSGRAKSCGCLNQIHSLVGARFGKLLVTARAPNDSNSAVTWRCLCDCGNTRLVRADRLKNGEVADCGCAIAQEMIGRQFGRLTVLGRGTPTQPHKDYRYWECSCSCGGRVLVPTTSLLSSKTRSCGCLVRSVAGKYLRARRLATVAEGVQRCSGCKTVLDLSHFTRSCRYVTGYKTLCKDCSSHRHRKDTYGISQEVYECMLTSQGHACAICGRHFASGSSAAVVDHDHSSGRVRGLLCNSCNTGLGRLKDSTKLLRSAIAYILRGSDYRGFTGFATESSERMRNIDLRRHFSIDLGRYREVLSLQSGGCAICETRSFGTTCRALAVDHCHASGAVRGLLCTNCNSALGSFTDNVYTMASAIMYLDGHARLEVTRPALASV